MDYKKLDDCYNVIKENIPLVESLKIVRTVHEFREFWKPENVKVILLAESHVYTDDNEWDILLKPNSFLPQNYPQHFVRFVYCIAYGENHLLNEPTVKNYGTFQYWKIFYSCLNNVKVNDYDFSSILKTGTLDNNDRVKKKINLLNSLKENGIWLVDASIVGINNEENIVQRENIIELCWKHYINDLILRIKPQHIIVIGKTVANVIGNKLDEMSINWSWRFQPQARKPSSVHHEAFDHYFSVCNSYKEK